MTRRCTALLLALACTAAHAETRYVSEELIVGVYSQPDLQGERVGQVRSADRVELLGSEGDAAQVRTESGVEGWMKASYLQTEAPLGPQLDSARAELEKLRKAESGRVDPKPLQKEIADLKAALQQARQPQTERAAPPAAARIADEEPIEVARPVENRPLKTALWVLFTALAAGSLGFGLGWRALDRRVRAKYGGIKVY